MHLPAPSSIHFHPAPTQLHPTHFSLHPALCNTLDVIRTKVSHVIGQFPQTYAEKLKAVHFNWKLAHMVYWRRWYGIQTYIFEILTPKFISGQIWADKVNYVFFFLNWHKWNLEDADSYSTLNPFLGKFLKIRFKVFLIRFGLCPQSNNLVGF